MVVASFANSLLGGRTALRQAQAQQSRSAARAQPVRAAATVAEKDASLGFKTMRSGIKEAAAESVLTPRFYTTDFDEMEELFSLEKNPNLDMDEFDAMLSEFKTDYNQTHFVRENETFKKAAGQYHWPSQEDFHRVPGALLHSRVLRLSAVQGARKAAEEDQPCRYAIGRQLISVYLLSIGLIILTHLRTSMKSVFHMRQLMASTAGPCLTLEDNLHHAEKCIHNIGLLCSG